MTAVIVDYGAGNLRSIINACKSLGFEIEVSSSINGLKNGTSIILPGVGSFGNAMRNLDKFKGVIRDMIGDGVPFLGLCLGIQVLLESSEESPGVGGLSILRGTCRRFPNSVKIPHMGWNSITIKDGNPLLEGVNSESLFYFVHSYYPEPSDNEVVVATTSYGPEFPCVIAKDNVFATQFHPEKSGRIGLKILKNFLELEC